MWLRPAAGTAASEGPPPGVQRDEVPGVPEPEHTGGDDAGVSLRRRPPRHGDQRPPRNLGDAGLFHQDEEAEGGNGGRGQGAGREQPLPGEVTVVRLHFYYTHSYTK